MRPQRLTLLWQRSGRPGSFYTPTLHEPAYLLARVSGARPNQHRHRLLQATAFCILLQPPPRKRTQPVLQSPSQITVSIHAFTQAACAGRAGLSPKRHTTNRPKLLFAHSPTRNRTAVTLFLSLSSSLPISAYLSLVSPLSLLSLRGALPLALGLIYIRSPEDTIDTSTCSNGVLPSPSLSLSLSLSLPLVLSLAISLSFLLSLFSLSGALSLLPSASSMFAPSRTPVTRPAVTLSFSVFLSLSVSCPRPHH